MRLCITGHRPNKLFGYDIHSSDYTNLRNKLDYILENSQPELTFTGMALGIDQIFAEECIRLHIPFVACVPFKGQENVWNQASKELYYSLLNCASDVVIVSDGGYSAHKLQIRNEYMVNSSDYVLAVWNRTSGGTANCVNYANQQHKPVVIINPYE